MATPEPPPQRGLRSMAALVQVETSDACLPACLAPLRASTERDVWPGAGGKKSLRGRLRPSQPRARLDEERAGRAAPSARQRLQLRRAGGRPGNRRRRSPKASFRARAEVGADGALCCRPRDQHCSAAQRERRGSARVREVFCAPERLWGKREKRPGTPRCKAAGIG